jgi:N-[(2S)-2-amino-2-carboxyethyl]-L-glutamate dehydrogenase
MATDTLLYLSSDDVLLACEEIDPVAAVRDALVLQADGRVRLPSEALLEWEPDGGGSARSISMPAFLDDDLKVGGTKIINASTRNPVRGLPRASGVVVLFDTVTARPLCLMEASHISGLRTASVTILAAQHLLTRDAATAAFIGAGPLTRHHAILAALRLPQITLCRITDLVPERAHALCQALGDLVSPDRMKFEAVGTSREAVSGADLVVPCTTTRQPYIRRDWLTAGCVAVNISLDDLCEDVLLGADRLYIDDWNLVMSDSHRLLGRLARAGRVRPAGADTGPPASHDSASQVVTGTIGELILGRCAGRTAEDQLCVVNPFGMAIEDVSLAHRVYQVANMRALGVNLLR